MDPKLKAAQQELTDLVMGWEGVSGTAIGERKGTPCLIVYLSDPAVGKRLPKAQGGFAVVVEVTGRFKRV
jgi:hypothetical protein